MHRSENDMSKVADLAESEDIEDCDGTDKDVLSEEQSESELDQDKNSPVISPDVTEHITAAVESCASRIIDVFEQKLAYDTTKQQQIDRLHAELQEHRTDLITRTNRPLINGLIRLHDDIGKLVENYRKKPVEELGPNRIFSAFEGIQDDIEILLDQNGIVSFTEQGEVFEPRKQRVVRQIDTSQEELVGTVADRLRPGFEQSESLIQKERVSVYVLEKAGFQKEDDFHENRKTDKEKAPDTIETTGSEENND